MAERHLTNVNTSASPETRQIPSVKPRKRKEANATRKLAATEIIDAINPRTHETKKQMRAYEKKSLDGNLEPLTKGIKYLSTKIPPYKDDIRNDTKKSTTHSKIIKTELIEISRNLLKSKKETTSKPNPPIMSQ